MIDSKGNPESIERTRKNKFIKKYGSLIGCDNLSKLDSNLCNGTIRIDNIEIDNKKKSIIAMLINEYETKPIPQKNTRLIVRDIDQLSGRNEVYDKIDSFPKMNATSY